MFTGRSALRLAVGLALICAGYILGVIDFEPGFAGALVVAIVVLAVWLLLVAETKASQERFTTAAIEASVADEVAREMDRARRHGTPLTIARFALGSTTKRGDRISRLKLEDVQRAIRTLDRAWLDNHDLYILMAESDRRQAQPVLERLARAIPSLDGVEPMAASFPDDAVTIGGLAQSLGIEMVPWMRPEVGPMPPRSRPTAPEALAVEAIRPSPPRVERNADTTQR
jgi:hypothetical protein